MRWRCWIRSSRSISAKAEPLDQPDVDADEVEPRLYLIGPAAIEAEDVFLNTLSAVFERARPAAFLLRKGSAGREAAGDFRRLAMERETAFLVEDDLDLAQTVAADGIHLSDPSMTGQARNELAQDQILGVDVDRSRHDAMTAGEAGADYIAFGRWSRQPGPDLVDLVVWWRDLFVLPCLAYADGGDQAASLAEAGADFIAVSDAVWNDPESPAIGARRLQAAIEGD